jgi:hypothetical protein
MCETIDVPHMTDAEIVLEAGNARRRAMYERKT